MGHITQLIHTIPRLDSNILSCCIISTYWTLLPRAWSREASCSWVEGQGQIYRSLSFEELWGRMKLPRQGEGQFWLPLGHHPWSCVPEEWDIPITHEAKWMDFVHNTASFFYYSAVVFNTTLINTYVFNVLICSTSHVVYNILEILFTTATNNILLRDSVLHLKANVPEGAAPKWKLKTSLWLR